MAIGILGIGIANRRTTLSADGYCCSQQPWVGLPDFEGHPKPRAKIQRAESQDRKSQSAKMNFVRGAKAAFIQERTLYIQDKNICILPLHKIFCKIKLFHSKFKNHFDIGPQ